LLIKKKNEKAELLNVIATGIYQAVLPSNFSIVERNIGSSLPNYANLGFEAKVNPRNNTDFIIKVQIRQSDDDSSFVRGCRGHCHVNYDANVLNVRPNELKLHKY